MMPIDIDNPLRLEILTRLTGLLESISTADGYVIQEGYADTDLTGKVFRGRAVFGDSDPIPMLSLLEVPIPLDQLSPPTSAGMSSGGWELMVQGFTADDRDNPTDPAHILLADVKRKLALEKHKENAMKAEDGILGIGNSVTGILIAPGVVRPPDEVSAKAYFWLTITIELAEDLTEPYRA